MAIVVTERALHLVTNIKIHYSDKTQESGGTNSLRKHGFNVF